MKKRKVVDFDESILEPPVDDPAVIELYKLIKEYIYYGKIRTTPKYNKMINLETFDYSENKVIEIIQRLNGIKKYRIKDPELILNLFVDIFKERKHISLEDIRVLKIIIDNPLISQADLARRLSISKVAAKQKFERVRDLFKLHFAAFLNPLCVKLKHLFVYFIVETGNTRLLKEYLSTPFTMNINVDVFTEVGGLISGWATFYVPNKKTALENFKKMWVNLLASGIVKDYEIITPEAISYGVNLDFFDGSKWYFDSFKVVYSLNFLKDNLEFYKLPDFHYYTPCNLGHLTQADLILLFSLMNKSRRRLIDLKQDLKKYNLNYSLQWISKRRKLFFEKALKPYVYVNNLGLTTAILIVILFKDSMLQESKELFSKYFANFFPLYFMTVSEEGMVVFLEVPPTSLGDIAYRVKSMIPPLVEDFKIITRYYNLGSKGFLDLVPFWDSQKQTWDIPKNIFLDSIPVMKS